MFCPQIKVFPSPLRRRLAEGIKLATYLASRAQVHTLGLKTWQDRTLARRGRTASSTPKGEHTRAAVMESPADVDLRRIDDEQMDGVLRAAEPDAIEAAPVMAFPPHQADLPCDLDGSLI